MVLELEPNFPSLGPVPDFFQLTTPVSSKLSQFPAFPSSPRAKNPVFAMLTSRAQTLSLMNLQLQQTYCNPEGDNNRNIK